MHKIELNQRENEQFMLKRSLFLLKMFGIKE